METTNDSISDKTIEDKTNKTINVKSVETIHQNEKVQPENLSIKEKIEETNHKKSDEKSSQQINKDENTIPCKNTETKLSDGGDENEDIKNKDEDSESYSFMKDISMTLGDIHSTVGTYRSRARTRLKRRAKFVRDKIDQYYDSLPWAIGATSRILGINFAPIHIPMERRLQTFSLIWFMSNFIVLGLGSWILFYYLFFYTQLWWIVLAYATWFFADMDISSRGGRKSNWMRNWKIWKYKRDYYPVHLIKTADIPPDRNYIMGIHPHGIVASGIFTNFATEATGFSKTFPGINLALVTLKLNFLVPLYRDYILMTGAIDSSKESITHKLQEKDKGNAVLIVVGGAREALDCHPGMETLTLKKRKGFCKLALRQGASLVPIYSFGENDVYDQLHNPEGSWTRRIQELLLKYCGVAPCFFFGRGIFQYSFGLIPYRSPIYSVVGSPIPVTQVENPTQEDIDALHTQYVEALTKLYNDHKDQYSHDPTIELIIK